MCDSIWNFRTLGGPLFYQINTNEVQNPLGMNVYRCARPDHVSEEDLLKLKSHYGIRYFLDLRSYKDEYQNESGAKLLDKSSFSCVQVLDLDTVEKRKLSKAVWLKDGKTVCKLVENDNTDNNLHHYMISVFGPNFVLQWISAKHLSLWKKIWGIFLLILLVAFGSKQFSNFFQTEIERGGLLTLYKSIIDYSGVSLRMALRLINKHGNAPFVICCHAGKDRTGIMSAVILSVCGFDKELIANDYAMSEMGLKFSNVELKKYSHEMQRAPKAVMLDLLNYIDEKYGSMSDYLTSIGFSLEEQKRLKKNLRSNGQ